MKVVERELRDLTLEHDLLLQASEKVTRPHHLLSCLHP